MDRALEFIGPCGIGEGALDAVVEFDGGLFGTDELGELGDDLGAALHQVFGDEVQHLGAAMCGGLRPLAGCTRCFDCIADVLAIAQRSFADEASVAAVDRVAVSRVGAGLLASDVLLDGTVDAEIHGCVGRVADGGFGLG